MILSAALSASAADSAAEEDSSLLDFRRRMAELTNDAEMAPAPMATPAPAPAASAPTPAASPGERPSIESAPPTPARSGADDGSIWTPVNAWDEEWERKFSQWVEDTIDPDFFVRLNLWTDCADVPYLVRWIFARIHSLPAGCHDFRGNAFGHWSKGLSHLPRHDDWKKDKRFLQALIEVNQTVLVRSLPFDTYPIRVMPEAGFLRPGTVVTDDKHSRIVTQVDRHSFHPIIMSSSTLPPQVRRLMIEPFNEDAGFDAEFGWGLCNFNWWRFDAEQGRWDVVPDEQMPGYSKEQYDLLNQLNEPLAGYLQRQYAYTVDDPKVALAELLVGTLNFVRLRQDVVDRGYAYFQRHRGAIGDFSTDAYDYFSTGQRDERLKMKFDNLRELARRGHFTEQEIRQALANETFRISTGEECSLLELCYASDLGLLSPRPWDAPLERWGGGGWRLEWESDEVPHVDHQILPGPQNGIIAAGGSGATALGPDGDMLWQIGRAGGDFSPPARDEEGVFYLINGVGNLMAVNDRGKMLWEAGLKGSEFSRPGVDAAQNIVVAVSDQGAAQAFDRRTGEARWTADLGGHLRGPAMAADGPAAAAESGLVHGLTFSGEPLWEVDLGSKIYAAPAVNSRGDLLVACEDGRVVCLGPGGGVRWERDTGKRLVFSPAVDAQDRVFAIGDSTLFCISPQGDMLWTCEAGRAIYAAPAITEDGRVYFGAIDRKLYALSADGRLRWTFPTPGSILGRPYAAPGGRIYVASLNKRIYALRDRQ